MNGIFSCYGQITSLNGEPEPGVIVEAVGRDDCSMYQEESKTEQNGQYRIRGLQVIHHRVKQQNGQYRITRLQVIHHRVKQQNGQYRIRGLQVIHHRVKQSRMGSIELQDYR